MCIVVVGKGLFAISRNQCVLGRKHDMGGMSCRGGRGEQKGVIVLILGVRRIE